MRKERKQALIVFIEPCVFWVSCEAIPRVKDVNQFLDASKELISNLSHSNIRHEIQDPFVDREKVNEILQQERTHKYVRIITPEPQLYSGLVGDSPVVEVNISRKVDIPSWKTKGHEKNIPIVGRDGLQNIFLDSVCFTGRTLEEVARKCNVDTAVFELVGKHAQNKISKLGIPVKYSSNVGEYSGLWHVDDLVQGVQMEGERISASDFVRDFFGKLAECKNPEEFRTRLRELKIKEVQTSPSLFLELARPDSYLAKSFKKEAVFNAKPLIEKVEAVYTAKGR